MRKILKTFFKHICYLLFLPFWYLQLCIPRKKNLWVFGAYGGQKYADSPRWLYEYILEHHTEYKVVWITKNFDVYAKLNHEKKPVAMTFSIRGIMVCLRASVSISSHGNGDVNKFFINGIRSIWTWHGMPIKKLRYDDFINDNLFRNPFIVMFTKIFEPYNQLQEKTITSSDFFVPFLQSAFNLKDHNSILKTGLPRCDAFFSQKSEPIVMEIRERFLDCKIIFYLPTFRTAYYDGKMFNPFENIYFNEKFFFEKLEKNNFVFLYKPHYFDKISINLNHERLIYLKDNDFDDLYILLKDIDILMTDYSSVYFDFIVMRKSVILAPFDYEEYLRTARDHYFDYFDNMEGHIVRTWEELYNLLEVSEFIPVSENTINKYCQYNDGKSCKKLFEQINER
jgi:CDP-glycerol glycerophosphotransferase